MEVCLACGCIMTGQWLEGCVMIRSEVVVAAMVVVRVVVEWDEAKMVNKHCFWHVGCNFEGFDHMDGSALVMAGSIGGGDSREEV